MQLTNVQRRLLQVRLERHQNTEEEIVWTLENFKEQTNFINSTAFKVAAQCPRRSGKSYGIALKMVKVAKENPGCNVLYIALTRDSAKRILYKDILVHIFIDKKIHVVTNSTDLTFTLNNGSIIKLLGADTSDKEMDKLLGAKYKLVAIDEAAFFKQDIMRLIEEILEPALIDEQGQLYMVSTTSDNVHSYYYDVVTGKVKGWEVHKWTAYDNPLMEENWKKAIALKIKNDPDIVKTPGYRRMYLNQWVIDDNLKVYRFNADSIIDSLPKLHKGDKWLFGLGVDLGWNDETAFVVMCWCAHNPVLYIIGAVKKSGMDFIEVGEYINVLEAFYGKFQYKVVDNASKQGVETMRIRCNIDFIPAQKLGKRDHIEIFNTEISVGRIKIVADGNSESGAFLGYNNPLLDEWANLIWNEALHKKGVYEELASCPNHLSDASLYNWWHSYNNTSATIPKPKPEFGDEEYMYQEAEKNNRMLGLENIYDIDQRVYDDY